MLYVQYPAKRQVLGCVITRTGQDGGKSNLGQILYSGALIVKVTEWSGYSSGNSNREGGREGGRATPY